MTLALLAQSILNGLAAGWVYVLVAVGLTLVFGIMNIVQFAHGEIYMLGAYASYFLIKSCGFSFWEALPLTAIVIGLLGVVLERFFFRPFRGRFEPSIIVAVGLMVLLQTTAVVGFGTSTKSMPGIIPGVLTVGGITLSWDRLLAILFGIVLVSALFLLIQKTKIGQAMVAVSQDPYAAALQGIDVNRISAVAMVLGCALAAIAGSLIGSIFGTSPFMGTSAIIKGIAVIILGGLGSIPGAVAGGLILGLIDGLVPPLLSPTMAGIVGFGVIIIVLLFRPQGLFGHE
ncbi:MAG: branched-chain amino acid ABC transporter permease [Dehalococcoidia bacterium]|nr:branched-chain amino acid ABC transporter permease [Dehalococcoidia bacterium]